MMELSPPLPPCDSYASDAVSGSTLRGVDCTAASPVKKVDSVESTGRSVLFCPGHLRRRITYAEMITVAIMDSPNWQMSLTEIYRYTRNTFSSVRFGRNWLNAIRHTLSISPLFVKVQRAARGNAHYWSVVPLLKDTLEQHLSSRNQSCCRGELVCRLQRHCSQMLPRKRRPPSYEQQVRHRVREASAGQKISNIPSPTQNYDNRYPRNSSQESCRASIPPKNGQRRLEHPKSSRSAVDVKTDSGDELDGSPKVFLGPAPPLKPLIASAIMQSPYRHVPVSVVYAFCIIHCPYYRKKRRLCNTIIKGILAKEACFKRVPQEGNRPDYWMFDMEYKDLLEKDTCQPSRDLVHAASLNSWEHDHGLYPKQTQSGPDVDTFHSPNRQLIDMASESSLCTGKALSVPVWQRLQGSSQISPIDPGNSRGGAVNGGSLRMDDTESEHSCSPKRPRLCGPHLESLPRHDGPNSDHSFPDEPIDVCDVDIKEEPFPEELPMENISTEENREQRQNMCTTHMHANCYGTVKIKQEKQVYPAIVKYETFDTWC